MKNAKLILAAILGTLALSAASTMGQVLDLSGATIQGQLTGQTLFNSATLANDGAISTWVVSDPTIDSQGLIFIYQLENQGSDGFTGVNFNSYTMGQYVGSQSYSSVSNGSLSGFVEPTTSASPNFTFDIVTGGGAATFNGYLPNGSESWLLAIDTDVTAFNIGYGLGQDDFQAHGLILAPNTAVYGVPEPSSLALILMAGLACCGTLLRRRRVIAG
ncbi:MAG: PEP-CTERM sorting domain-containing protein [Limisphaerales bacterium]